MELKVIYNIFKIKKEWEILTTNNPDLTPFSYFEYNKFIFIQRWSRFLKDRVFPVFVIVQDNDETIMIAPLVRTVRSNYFMLGDVQGCGVTDFIYRKDISDETLNNCCTMIFKYCKKIEIGRMSENSKVYQSFGNREEFTSGITTDTLVNISLRESYEEYFNSLSKHSRQNLRTSYNRLKKENISYFLKIWENEDINFKYWNQINNVYCKRQKETYGANSSFLKFKNLIFKHDSISLRHNKNKFVAVLFYDNEIAAVLMGLKNIKGDIVVVPRLAINADFSHYSPGNQLLNECIRYLIENTAIRNVDLSRGTEIYKYVMGGDDYFTKNFIIEYKQEAY